MPGTVHTVLPERTGATWQRGVQDLAAMDAARFEEMHTADQMAVDKLRDGIEGFAADQRKLEELLATMAAEKGLGDPSDDE